jgi:hypothetical protein
MSSDQQVVAGLVKPTLRARAIDSAGADIDFPLSALRDADAVKRRFATRWVIYLILNRASSTRI